MAGIEASIRFTLLRLDGRPSDGELGETLSNEMIRLAGAYGLPVAALAFPGECDFATKILNKIPHVEVVHLRWNLMRGNISEYVRRRHDTFAPECLRSVSSLLLTISRNWTEQLGGIPKEPGNRINKNGKYCIRT